MMQFKIYLQLTHTRLRLSFSRVYCTNRRFNMSMKTIAVLDDAELKDGEMYVYPVRSIWVFASDLNNRTGRKSVSKMEERFFYLAWAIRCMQLVHIVPTTERPLPKVSWPPMAEWSGKCTAIDKFKLTYFLHSSLAHGTAVRPEFSQYSCNLIFILAACFNVCTGDIGM